MEKLIPALILFPFAIAVIAALLREDKLRGYAIYAGSAVTIGLALMVLRSGLPEAARPCSFSWKRVQQTI